MLTFIIKRNNEFQLEVNENMDVIFSPNSQPLWTLFQGPMDPRSRASMNRDFFMIKAVKERDYSTVPEELGWSPRTVGTDRSGWAPGSCSQLPRITHWRYWFPGLWISESLPFASSAHSWASLPSHGLWRSGGEARLEQKIPSWCCRDMQQYEYAEVTNSSSRGYHLLSTFCLCQTLC